MVKSYITSTVDIAWRGYFMIKNPQKKVEGGLLQAVMGISWEESGSWLSQ